MTTSTRWTEAETIEVGEGMFELAKQNQARLDKRGITVEFLAESDQSLEAARAAGSGQEAKLGAQRASTKEVEALIEKIGKRVVAIRTAIQRVHPDRDDIQAAFGVGTRVGGSVSGASDAVDLVLTAAAKYPDESKKAAIIEADLTALSTMRDTLRATDKAQEQKKAAKRTATDTRNAQLDDITARVDRILAAAALEFVDEPDLYARFEALIPSKKADDNNGPPPQPGS